MSVTIQALARHLLTAGGGFLVAQGYLDATSRETVVGALVALIGVGWSMYEKRSR